MGNPPHEERPSGLGHLAKQLYTCEVCGRGFPEKEQYDTQAAALGQKVSAKM